MKRKFLIVSVVLLALAAFSLPVLAQVNPDCEMPNVLIVQDRSGSMQGSNWNAAVGAVKNIVGTYDDSVRFGLMLFPGYSTGGTCTWGGACQTDNDCSGFFNFCEADSCGPGGIDVAIADFTATPISTTMDTAQPSGSTPMADSLNAANNYAELKDPNRRNFILLITDGDETCGGTPTQAVQDLSNAGIGTFVVGFGSGVNPNALNQMAQIGGTARPGGPPYYYQADNPQELNQAIADIFISITDEICDGLDNDCDGTIDEGTDEACQTQCGSGTRHCVAGVLGQCVDSDGNLVPEPDAEEICDCIDNDCDGMIDEDEYGNPLSEPCGSECGDGARQCIDCKWTECSAGIPIPEACDGEDNDCDGMIDEDESGNPLSRDCQNACGSGTQQCVGGEWGPCSAGEPTEEICDGLDNDCDGIIDEDIPLVGDPCLVEDHSLLGPCSAGVFVCDPALALILCEPGAYPETEICDFIDNDCDGEVDEGLRNACGLCSDSNAEICDGRDNDCNGEIDDNAICNGAGEVCYNGECVRSCSGGECPPNYNCVDTGNGEMRCVSLCSSVECPEGEMCDKTTGECVDLCEGQHCPEGQSCYYGACVADNCYSAGCPDGERCVSGQCVADPCAGVECGESQYCRTYDDGTAYCYNSCDRVSCRADEKCVNGECVEDLCYDDDCPEGQKCIEGECHAVDNCAGCLDGQDCLDGQCYDSPCVNITCPAGSVCVDGECLPPSDENPADCNLSEKPLCCKDGVPQTAKCVDFQWSCGDADWGPCPPGGCESDEDCDDGKICQDGACVKVQEPNCETDEDCGTDEKCLDGQCVYSPPITDDDDIDDDDDDVVNDDDDNDDTDATELPSETELNPEDEGGCGCRIR